MAEMSEKKPFRIPKAKRFEVYIEMKRQGKINSEIADALGISERQLDRHIAEWKENGALDNWILSEWIITYDTLQEEKGGTKETFKGLTKWLLKRMKEQSEVKVESKMDVQVNAGREITELLAKYDALFKEGTVSKDSS